MRATGICFVLMFFVSVKQTHSDGPMHPGFYTVIENCKNELNLPENVISDLFYLWKQEYEKLTRDTGCILVCMTKKLEMLDPDGKLHHGQTKMFAMHHGADEALAMKIVAALQDCEKNNEGNDDECLRVLEIAKCFRTAIHELNWAPKVDTMVDEVLAGA